MRLSCFTEDEFSGILNLLESLLKISQDKIKKIYKEFDFNIDRYSDKHWNDFKFYQKHIYKPKYKDSIEVYNSASLIGIDLPIMLSNETEEFDKTIMIVGEDPLRKDKDFKNRKSEVVIGTPYAFHSKYYREKRTKVYWKVVEHIISKGFRVYLTDIFKVWVEGEKKKLFFKADDEKFFIDLLQKEIEILNPDLLITFGNKSRDFVTAKISYPESKQLFFPHPTGSNNSIWSQILNEKATNDAKIQHLTNEFSQRVN
jgi:hypothetical protein